MVRRTIAELESERIFLEELDATAEALARNLCRTPSKPQRDAKGRWIKGESGNRKGRPHKETRTLTTRNEIKSFLAATEAVRKVKTPDGIVEVPAIDLIHRSIVAKAAEGHGPSQRYVMKKAAPNLASSMNIGAFNLGNAAGAALGGAVIAAGFSYPWVSVAGAAMAGAALTLVLLTSRTRV